MAHTITAPALRRLLVAVFAAAGAPDDLAGSVADALVDNHLAGHDSHGVVRVGQYLQAVDDGEVDPRARPSIRQQTATTAVVDGHWGFGQATADAATDLLIEKVLADKVASVATVDVNHTGRLAVWTERAARRGVAMFMAIGTVGRPRTAPFGGAAAVFGTNPVAFTIPDADGTHVTLDYATSAIANGKIMVAQSEGQQLPPGVIVTASGEPTTDPDDFAAGGHLLPFGAHKGYALAVIAELLGTVLTGADDGTVIPPRSGIFMFGIAADAFRPADDYQTSMTATVERITSVPPATGFDEVLLPGMPEARQRAQRLEHGIPIGDALWATVLGLAQARGVDPEAVID